VGTTKFIIKTKRNARDLLIKLAPQSRRLRSPKQAEIAVDDMQHRWLSIYEQSL